MLHGLAGERSCPGGNLAGGAPRHLRGCSNPQGSKWKNVIRIIFLYRLLRALALKILLQRNEKLAVYELNVFDRRTYLTFEMKIHRILPGNPRIRATVHLEIFLQQRHLSRWIPLHLMWKRKSAESCTKQRQKRPAWSQWTRYGGNRSKEGGKQQSKHDAVWTLWSDRRFSVKMCKRIQFCLLQDS